MKLMNYQDYYEKRKFIKIFLLNSDTWLYIFGSAYSSGSNGISHTEDLITLNCPKVTGARQSQMWSAVELVVLVFSR